MVLFSVGVVTNILKGPHPISTAYCAGDGRRPGREPAGLFRARPTRRRCCGSLRLVPLYVVVVLAFGFVSLTIERDTSMRR